MKWHVFPKTRLIREHLRSVLDLFELKILLTKSDFHFSTNDEILQIRRTNIDVVDFLIEIDKISNNVINVSLLFENGKPEKYFNADGYYHTNKTNNKVNASRVVSRCQLVKALF